MTRKTKTIVYIQPDAIDHPPHKHLTLSIEPPQNAPHTHVMADIVDLGIEFEIV